jgi:hypothetical protein
MKITLILTTTLLMAFSVSAQVSFPSLEKGLEFRSLDNKNLVNLSFRAQTLFTYTPDNNGNAASSSFLVRRSRIKLDGFLADPRFGFKFEMGLTNRDIGARSDLAQVNTASRLILDAVFKYKASKNLQIWFGQTKLPGNRERVISSQKLQFVDRSLVNSRFNIDRDITLQFHYKYGDKMPFAIIGAISNGEGRNMTIDNVNGFDYTGRVEFLPLGKFASKGDYVSSDLAREEEPKISFGATYDYNEGATRQRGQLGNFVTDTVGAYGANLSTLFIDMIFKYKGWSALAEYAYKENLSTQKAQGPLSSNFGLGSGITFQAGYLFKNNFELAGRYTNISTDDVNGDFLSEDNDGISSLRDETEYTLGLSKYIVGHTLKWQTDLSYTERPGNDPFLRYRFQLEFGF